MSSQKASTLFYAVIPLHTTASVFFLRYILFCLSLNKISTGIVLILFFAKTLFLIKVREYVTLFLLRKEEMKLKEIMEYKPVLYYCIIYRK